MALIAPDGGAKIEEILSKDENLADDPNIQDEFENDKPAIQKNEVFSQKSSETDQDPIRSEVIIASTGEKVREEDIPKIFSGEVTVSENKDGTWTKSTVTPSVNAIQKAVNKALSSLQSDTESVTISVESGSYYDGLNVSIDSGYIAANVKNDKDSTLNTGNLKFYILADGSYTEADEGKLIDKSTIDATSDGSVKVYGDVNLKGINVILAGIVMAGNNTQIKNTDDLELYWTIRMLLSIRTPKLSLTLNTVRAAS